MSIGNTLELIQRSKPLTRHAVNVQFSDRSLKRFEKEDSIKAGSGTNLERSLPQDRRMLRQCWLQQQSATTARYGCSVIVCKNIQLLWRANFSSISRCKCSAIAG
jgi:hypothetical protein